MEKDQNSGGLFLAPKAHRAADLGWGRLSILAPPRRAGRSLAWSGPTWGRGCLDNLLSGDYDSVLGPRGRGPGAPDPSPDRIGTAHDVVRRPASIPARLPQ